MLETKIRVRQTTNPHPLQSWITNCTGEIAASLGCSQIKGSNRLWASKFNILIQKILFPSKLARVTDWTHFHLKLSSTLTQQTASVYVQWKSCGIH